MYHLTYCFMLALLLAIVNMVNIIRANGDNTHKPEREREFVIYIMIQLPVLLKLSQLLVNKIESPIR